MERIIKQIGPALVLLAIFSAVLSLECMTACIEGYSYAQADPWDSLPKQKATVSKAELDEVRSRIVAIEESLVSMKKHSENVDKYLSELNGYLERKGVISRDTIETTKAAPRRSIIRRGNGRSGHCGNPNCSMCNRNWGRLSGAVPIKPKIESTPQPIVEAMLASLKLSTEDVVYDLGCGDGRFLKSAVEGYGCKAVGIEIDPKVIAYARREVVNPRISIQRGSALDSDLKDATAVVLYQDHEFIEQVQDKLLSIGRVASYFHPIPGMDNKEQVINVDGEVHQFYVATQP